MSQPCMAGRIENDVVEGSVFVQLAGFVCIKYKNNIYIHIYICTPRYSMGLTYLPLIYLSRNSFSLQVFDLSEVPDLTAKNFTLLRKKVAMRATVLARKSQGFVPGVTWPVNLLGMSWPGP